MLYNIYTLKQKSDHIIIISQAFAVEILFMELEGLFLGNNYLCITLHRGDTDRVIVIHRSMYGTINATLLVLYHYSTYTTALDVLQWKNNTVVGYSVTIHNSKHSHTCNMYTHQNLLRSQDMFSVSQTAKSVKV